MLQILRSKSRSSFIGDLTTGVANTSRDNALGMGRLGQFASRDRITILSVGKIFCFPMYRRKSSSLNFSWRAS